VSQERQVARRAGGVSAATMVSRVLGLVREQVMAGLFGAGFATDAFNVAFRIPNLVRDLVAEGAMSSAFIPAYTEERRKRGDAEAFRFGAHLVLALALVLSALCLIAGWMAPALVAVIAPGFGAVAGKLDLTVLLTRVMLPFLPLLAMAAALMGMMNAHGRFTGPALAPAVQNVLMVVIGVALIPICNSFGQQAVLAMAIGVTAGALGQFLWQLPPLLKLGFRLRWEWPFRDPAVRRVAIRMIPATVGLAATQLNLFVSTLIASLLPQGSVSWLWYAFRLMQLPIGVFGVALATVSLPELSRAAVDGDHARLKNTLSATVRLVALLTIPAAFALAALAEPLMMLLYEHGRFTASDTVATAHALVMYCVGLPAFAAVGVLTRTFYALGDTRTPVRATFVAVALNIALNLALMRPLGHLGLALATSLTSIANLGQLAFLLRRRIGPIEGRRALATVLRVGVASALAGAVAYVGARTLAAGWRGNLVLELLGTMGLGLAFLGLGYIIMRQLRVSEIATLEDLVRGLGRRLKPPPD
jgi:putative peptidoglycan lipid II flippase